MKIETKFDIGQKVWFTPFFAKNHIKEAIIKQIKYDGYYTSYLLYVNGGIWDFEPESLIFATKESAEKYIKEKMQNESNND